MKKKVLFVFHETDPLSGGNASMLDAIINIKKNESFDIMGLVPYKKDKKSIGVSDVLSDMGISSIEARYFSSRYQCEQVGIKETIKIVKCIVRNLISIISSFGVYRRVSHSGIAVVYTNTSDLYVGSILAKLLCAKHIWHFREFGYEDQKAHHFDGRCDFFIRCQKNFQMLLLLYLDH